jgi:hypothetical protein
MAIPIEIKTSRVSNLLLRRGQTESAAFNSSELVAFHFYLKDWFAAFKLLISNPESANEAYKLYLYRIMPSNLMLHLTQQQQQQQQEESNSCDLLGAAILATRFPSTTFPSNSKYLELAIAFESLFHSVGKESQSGCSLVRMFQFLDSFYAKKSDCAFMLTPTPGEMVVWNEILERLCLKAKDSLAQLIQIGNWKSQQIVQALYLLALNENK